MNLREQLAQGLQAKLLASSISISIEGFSSEAIFLITREMRIVSAVNDFTNGIRQSIEEANNSFAMRRFLGLIDVGPDIDNELEMNEEINERNNFLDSAVNKLQIVNERRLQRPLWTTEKRGEFVRWIAATATKVLLSEVKESDSDRVKEEILIAARRMLIDGLASSHSVDDSDKGEEWLHNVLIPSLINNTLTDQEKRELFKQYVKNNL